MRASACSVLFVSVLLALAVGCSHSAARRSAALAPPEPGDSTARMLVVVYTVFEGVRPCEPPVLVAAVSGEGTAFWSSDWIAGGPPYFRGRVASNRLDVLRGQAVESIRDEDRCTLMSDTPPDAPYMTIYASVGAQKVEMSSCRELVESDPRLICTDRGIESLGDRSRQEVEAQRSEAYRKCLARWDAIRSAVRDLLPARGEAVAELPDKIREILGLTEESEHPKAPQRAPRWYD